MTSSVSNRSRFAETVARPVKVGSSESSGFDHSITGSLSASGCAAGRTSCVAWRAGRDAAADACRSVRHVLNQCGCWRIFCTDGDVLLLCMRDPSGRDVLQRSDRRRKGRANAAAAATHGSGHYGNSCGKVGPTADQRVAVIVGRRSIFAAGHHAGRGVAARVDDGAAGTACLFRDALSAWTVLQRRGPKLSGRSRQNNDPVGRVGIPAVVGLDWINGHSTCP